MRSTELEALASIRGHVDVHGTVEIVFFKNLSCPITKQKLSHRGHRLRHVPHEFVPSSRSSNSISASTLGLRRVRSRMSSRSAWIRAALVRSQCGSTPARKKSEGGNVMVYTMITLHSHPRHFQPKAIQVRASKGNWLAVKKQIVEMLERGGPLNEHSGVYERRDRAEAGLGKGEFLSHCRGYGDGGRTGG